MNVTVRQLHAFVTVADMGSFTRAAHHLNVAQSALSILIRSLETELGLALFDRTTRRVELTSAGAEFRGNAERLLADLELAVRNTRDLAERRRGRIAVATAPLLASVMMPGILAAFRKDFPGVQTVLLDDRTDQILTKVKSGEADLGIGTFSVDDEELDFIPVAADRLMLFAHVDNPLARTEPSWAMLKDEPLITLGRESHIRKAVERGYNAAGLTAAPSFEVSHITTALAMVEAGLGASVLPSYSLRVPHADTITARVIQAPVLSRGITIATRRGRTLAPAASDLLERIRAQARLDEREWGGEIVKAPVR